MDGIGKKEFSSNEQHSSKPARKKYQASKNQALAEGSDG
jgi:hypothetical protein